jgi:hypothetical protein
LAEGVTSSAWPNAVAVTCVGPKDGAIDEGIPKSRTEQVGFCCCVICWCEISAVVNVERNVDVAVTLHVDLNLVFGGRDHTVSNLGVLIMCRNHDEHGYFIKPSSLNLHVVIEILGVPLGATITTIRYIRSE